MEIKTPEVTTNPLLKDNWILTEAFHYVGNFFDINLPKGFVTDLASIPRFLWRIIAPFELSLTAPIVHDFLYRNQGTVFTNNIYLTFTRKEVDDLFLAIMKDEGVSAWRRNIAYRGVRMFGGSSWGANTVQVVEVEG